MATVYVSLAPGVPALSQPSFVIKVGDRKYIVTQAVWIYDYDAAEDAPHRDGCNAIADLFQALGENNGTDYVARQRTGAGDGGDGASQTAP
jgi:hypothetical protein